MLTLDAVSLTVISLATRHNFFDKIELTNVAKLSQTGQTSNIIVVFACFCHVKDGSDNVNFQV